MIPPLDPDTGALPLGRHVATLSEVQNQFTTTDQRNDLWKKFLTVTGMFRGEGSVCAVWLSGSYLTSKEMPHDVDAVYWLGRGFDPRTAQRIARYVRDFMHMPLDCYPFVYEPTKGAGFTPDRYTWYRGYWDDLWCRLRSNDDNEARVSRRGYVEVIIDGWHS